MGNLLNRVKVVGSKYEFKCPNCQHTLESGVGEDWGMKDFNRSYCCEDCRKVFEVFTDWVELGEQPRDPLQVLVPEGKGEKCPKCKGRNTVFWDPKRSCPKCGKKMKKGDPVCLWD